MATVQWKDPKRIQTPPESIFFSFVSHEDTIHGFGRRHYAGNEIIPVTMNHELEDLHQDGEIYVGEDPRCFIHDERVFVHGNRMNDQRLYDIDQKTQINLGVRGKNLTYISHRGRLFFIHWLIPMALYEVELDQKGCRRIELQDLPSNSVSDHLLVADQDQYRGGTPGYALNDHEYYGFGHRTYYINHRLKHDVFLWKVSFGETDPADIGVRLYSLPQPPGSRNICDPTCVLTLPTTEGVTYLFTAESDDGWFSQQDYITNAYPLELVWDTQAKNLICERRYNMVIEW